MPQAETVARAQSRADQFRNRRKASTTTLTLPSGIEIEVRKVPLIEVMRHPSIPHPIASIVTKLVNDGARARAEGRQRKVEPGAVAKEFMAKVLEDPMANIAKVSNVALMLCGVDPVFVDGDGEIGENDVHVDEVELSDKVFVWSWLTGSDADAESFRIEPNALVAASPDSEDVQPATE